MPETTPNVVTPARFTATRWSLVLAAGGGDGQAALVWLCERYWYPLFAYVRGRGYTREDAEDLVQAFFEKLLADTLVARAEPERGRFRSFLLGCLDHFLAHESSRSQRVKRGGRVAFLSLENVDAEDWLQRHLSAASTPALDYDRAWALALLDRVLARLREECEGDGKAGRFAVLQGFIQGDEGALSLAEAAGQLGVSLAAMKSLVHRLRARFRELVREEVRETVSSPEEVTAEMQHLFTAFRG